MPALHTLRHARALAIGVLAWFVLSLGVAIASPVVKPQALTLVCSAAGAVKLVAGSDDGAAPAGHTTLDCVLCLVLDAPPVAAHTPLTLAPWAPVAPVSPQHAVLAWRAASPLPPRGPPAA